MGRIRASIEIIKASWSVLRQDPALLWLPVFSLLSTGIVVVGFGAGIFATSRTTGIGGQGEVHLGALGYVLMFAMYLVLAIVTVFFNAALVSAAHERLTGGDPTLESALAGATRRFGLLLPWAIVSATVSTILKAVQERAGLLGRLVAGIAGIAWGLVTFLVLPVIVVEGLTVGQAVRRSKELFVRTWGEQVVGNVAIGLLGFVAMLVTFPILLLAVASGSTALTIAGVVVFGLVLVAVIAVTSAMSAVFQTALYAYASTGQVPRGFEASAIDAAFRAKAGGGWRAYGAR